MYQVAIKLQGLAVLGNFFLLCPVVRILYELELPLWAGVPTCPCCQYQAVFCTKKGMHKIKNLKNQFGQYIIELSSIQRKKCDRLTSLVL